MADCSGDLRTTNTDRRSLRLFTLRCDGSRGRTGGEVTAKRGELVRAGERRIGEAEEKETIISREVLAPLEMRRIGGGVSTPGNSRPLSLVIPASALNGFRRAARKAAPASKSAVAGVTRRPAS